MSVQNDSKQEILVPRAPRRQDARDLQSRLYREIGHYHAIGVAAVEAELFPLEASEPVRLDGARLVATEKRSAA